MEKPLTVHRYSIPTTDAIERLIGSAAGDAEAWQIRVEGDSVVVDLVAPAAATEPSAKPKPAPREKKGGKNAQRAAIMCDQGAFHAWAEVDNSEAAREFILQRCGVESRVDLDHDAVAGAKFRDLAARYDAWMSGGD